MAMPPYVVRGLYNYFKTMNDKSKDSVLKQLDEDARTYIATLFYEDVVPKLKKLSARLGALNCEFAGEIYKYWNLRFRSVGSDFIIEGFEYDEDGIGIDLDL